MQPTFYQNNIEASVPKILTMVQNSNLRGLITAVNRNIGLAVVELVKGQGTRLSHLTVTIVPSKGDTQHARAQRKTFRKLHVMLVGGCKLDGQQSVSNMHYENLVAVDNLGQTTLHYAADAGNFEGIRLLIHSYQMWLKQCGYTEENPLFWTYTTHFVDRQSRHGNTALMFAAASGNFDAVTLLLFYSKKPFASNLMGQNVLEFASNFTLKLMLSDQYKKLVAEKTAKEALHGESFDIEVPNMPCDLIMQSVEEAIGLSIDESTEQDMTAEISEQLIDVEENSNSYADENICPNTNEPCCRESFNSAETAPK